MLYTRQRGYANIWNGEGLGTQGNDTKTLQLTTGTAVRSKPRISPDGHDVAFVETAAGGSNVFVMSIDGGPARQLTFMADGAWSPAWSPDGRQIAFGSDQGGNGRVWVVDVEGGAPQEFPATRFVAGNDLAWSPLSTIVYQRTDHRNFYLLDPATGQQELAWADSVLGWFYNPVPSPDGTAIAFRRTGHASLGLTVMSLTERTLRIVGPSKSGPIGWDRTGKTVYGMLGDSRADVSSEVYAFRVSDGLMQDYATLPVSVGARNIRVTEDGGRYVAAVAETQSDVWIIENFDPSRARR